MASSITSWLNKKALAFKHRDTLREYNNQTFKISSPSISLGDAIEAGIFNILNLHGPELERELDIFDERVWNAWHKASHWWKSVYAEDCERAGLSFEKWSPGEAKKLMPLNRLQSSVAHSDNVAFFEWLHALKTPIEPIIWDAYALLQHSSKVGVWAMKTIPEHLQVGDGVKHVEDIMNGRNYFNYRAFYKPYTLGTEHEAEVIETQRYFKDVFNKFLPPKEWPWQKRWAVFGDYQVHYAGDDWDKKMELCCMMGAYHVPALLDGCPLETQKILCAFKNTRHYLEGVWAGNDVDAKAIRRHFWGGPEEKGQASGEVLAILCMTEPGSDPDVAMRMWETLKFSPTKHESYAIEMAPTC